MLIWVQLSLVPLEFFTQKGLSYIASALGTPFYMDNITTLQKRLAYVKVCFEISVDFVLPGFINIELHDGSFVSIRVEVLWLPMHCLQCQSFSHSGKHYSKKNENALDGGTALTLTFEVSFKGKVVVVDLSPILKQKHVCLTGSSNRFEALSVELEDSNDVVADDIDTEQGVVDDDNQTEQLEFSPRKPWLASLAVAPLMRSP
ncbi:hypothetical protein Gotri_012782 [Gossypium trilobum]|uniref:DUF4283 domain-containing protein n=1 Tax=Gossypium trilobum TaxID=34281 RepID=A0A7J9DRD6_9ROSI|nr:hypothetical protein [Gossypium trilobum]